MLDGWKQAYFTTRAKIEESSKGSRWEFDRKKLFEKTDYMSKILEDLANIVSARIFCFSPMNVPAFFSNLAILGIPDYH